MTETGRETDRQKETDRQRQREWGGGRETTIKHQKMTSLAPFRDCYDNVRNSSGLIPPSLVFPLSFTAVFLTTQPLPEIDTPRYSVR